MEALEERRNPSHERFEIRDSAGELLLVLPFSEITEPAGPARRPPVSHAALQRSFDRARSLQAEVSDQIGAAHRQLCETKETLDRLQNITRAQNER